MDEVIEAQLVSMRAQIDSLLMMMQLRREIKRADAEDSAQIEIPLEEGFVKPPVFGAGKR